MRERGFTLLELMVVVSIIGLIAALASYHVVAADEGARIKLAEAKCQSYHDAVTSWMLITSAAEAPESLEALEAPLRPDANDYITVLEDPWGSRYRLVREGRRRFRVWSNGPDGEPGTEDDLCYEPKDE